MKEDLIAINVQGIPGIMTCIGVKKIDGKDILFGVSAAHVLLSNDRKPDLKDVIKIYNSQSSPNWNLAGILDIAIYRNGLGLFPNWGILDAGRFLFNNKYQQYLKTRISPLRKSAKLSDPKKLEGTTVYGYSVISGEDLNGKVKRVFAKLNNENVRFDLVIEFEKGITYKGDSGMLWKSRNGSAVGMHIYGNSKYSFSTLITRVRQSLDMSFYKIN